MALKQFNFLEVLAPSAMPVADYCRKKSPQWKSVGFPDQRDERTNIQVESDGAHNKKKDY